MSASPSLTSKKDLWTLIREDVSKSKSKSQVDLTSGNAASSSLCDLDTNALQAGKEHHFIFIGPKSSGKTSLIYRFLDKSEQIQPTTGLEYSFARRSHSNSNVKDICHVWEIAGGPALLPLLDIPLTSKNIHKTTVFLTMNLSDPSNLVSTLETYVSHLQKRVQTILNELETRGSKRPAALRKQSHHKYQSCTDPGLSLIPISWVFIGTHWHSFQQAAPLQQQQQALHDWIRYMAHTYGGHVLCLESHQSSSWFHSFAFHTSFPSSYVSVFNSSTDVFFMEAGKDRFQHLFHDASKLTYAQVKLQVQPYSMNYTTSESPTSTTNPIPLNPTTLENDLKTKYAEKRIDIECVY